MKVGGREPGEGQQRARSSGRLAGKTGGHRGWGQIKLAGIKSRSRIPTAAALGNFRVSRYLKL